MVFRASSLSLSICLTITCFLLPEVCAQDKAELEQLQLRLEQLQVDLQKLDIKNRVDAEVCSKAVEWILRHQEFYRPNYVQLAQKTLDLGKSRAEQLSQGKTDWGTTPGVHPVGYRSHVDESVQPYLVTLPVGFNSAAAKRWPLYVVLHGRNSRLTETSFIAGAIGKPAPKDQSWIQIDVFGRVNNAYRWAGETDVFEAMEDVIRRYKIDETRISLWGFSMGGAGAWHLGLHHPSKWASAGAGAGFVDFYKYQKQAQLPEYQHRTLRIYDALDYAQNLNVVPFVAYGGEIDPQLQSALFIQEEAQKYDIALDLIVGPKMGHKFDDVSKAKFMEFLAKFNKVGRNRVPGQREFDFVTYTLKYNSCEWLDILEQLTPYDKTTVQSEVADDSVLEVSTQNIAAMSILRNVADRVRIDGAGPFDLNIAADANLIEVYFVKTSEGWEALDYDDSLEFEKNPNRNKRHNLQGPIDDAFMQAFVCVRGTGEPWSPELQAYANWSLARFSKEFDKWMRAIPVVVDDTQVNQRQILQKNLVLFGDPGSNSILRDVLAELPVEWTKDKIVFNGQSYTTKDHCPVLIFPNPLNSAKYVVINTGMTTHEADFKASNSWLFPKLGDHAILQFELNKDGNYVEKTIDAGIFDSQWNK